MLTNNKYKWMKDYQRELYDSMCKEFNFKNLTDLGNFLNLNNPYHGAKLIFEAQKQNPYLKKIVAIKRESNRRIKELEAALSKINKFRNSIDNSLENLSFSLESVRDIKKALEED